MEEKASAPPHTTNTHICTHTYDDILSLWLAQDKHYPPSQFLSLNTIDIWGWKCFGVADSHLHS